MIDKRTIKAVGFDVDGTIYQIKDEMSIAIGSAVSDKAAELLDLDKDDFNEDFLEKREELKSNTKTLNSFGLDGEKIFRDVVEEFNFTPYIKTDHKLIKTIKILHNRYKLFIITNGSHTHVDRKLKLVGLDKKYFDPIIYCYDEGWLKPDPAPFLSALEKLQISPDEAVYVGDHPEVDIQGAKGTGMKTIQLGQTNEEADHSLETVYDILSVL